MLNSTEEYLEEWREIFEQRKELYTSKIIFSVSLIVVFLFGLVGNILICIVIYYDRTMHTITNYYLFDLAVSDVLLTFPILITISQMLIPDFNTVENTSGVLSCKVYLCIQYIFLALLWNHGVLVMTALSIERYIAICYPMTLLSTGVFKRVCKIILAIWGIAILETIPNMWTVDFIDTGKSLRCTFLLTSTSKIIIATSLFVITFVIPLGIMIFVYAMIAFKVNHQKYDFNSRTVCNSSLKRKKVNKLIVALTVSFVVCWLPTGIFRIALSYTDKRVAARYQSFFSIFHKIAMFNSWFSTVLNPLLLSVISTKFRKTLKILWNKKNKKTLSLKRDVFKNCNLDMKQEHFKSVTSRRVSHDDDEL